MKKKKKNYLKYIKSIENIRGKNNKNWMDLLRLAFKNDPKKTKIIVKRIFSSDKKINNVISELVR
mgnify:FL=1